MFTHQTRSVDTAANIDPFLLCLFSTKGFLGWAAAANNASSVPYSFSISYDATDAINLPLVTKCTLRVIRRVLEIRGSFL